MSSSPLAGSRELERIKMVEVTIQGEQVVFEVIGLHKLWALKSGFEVPVRMIKAARRDNNVMKGLWKGLRFPGTHIPGVIVAGTYFREGKKSFWDVVRSEGAIVVEVEGGPYDEVIVEVAEPEVVVKLIEEAIGNNAH